MAYVIIYKRRVIYRSLHPPITVLIRTSYNGTLTDFFFFLKCGKQWRCNKFKEKQMQQDMFI